VKNDPIRHPESVLDKKIRLLLPVLLGIRLHPKPSDSLRIRLRLRNRDSDYIFYGPIKQNAFCGHRICLFRF